MTFRLATVQTIVVGDIPIVVTRKRIKHVHLRVLPPDGRVTISAPRSARRHDVLAFAASRLEWIRQHQERVRRQEREPLRRYTSGESHDLWGRKYLLEVVESDDRQGVTFDENCIALYIRLGADPAKRAAVMHAWHKTILHEVLPELIRKWELLLNVRLERYSMRWMKSRWGSCNHRMRHVRLNTELVTKPRRLLEYVLVHEMVHLIVPNHGPRFVALMNQHYPSWREARAELNGGRRTGETVPPT